MKIYNSYIAYDNGSSNFKILTPEKIDLHIITDTIQTNAAILSFSLVPHMKSYDNWQEYYGKFSIQQVKRITLGDWNKACELSQQASIDLITDFSVVINQLVRKLDKYVYKGIITSVAKDSNKEIYRLYLSYTQMAKRLQHRAFVVMTDTELLYVNIPKLKI